MKFMEIILLILGLIAPFTAATFQLQTSGDPISNGRIALEKLGQNIKQTVAAAADVFRQTFKVNDGASGGLNLGGQGAGGGFDLLGSLGGAQAGGVGGAQGGFSGGLQGSSSGGLRGSIGGDVGGLQGGFGGVISAGGKRKKREIGQNNYRINSIDNNIRYSKTRYGYKANSFEEELNVALLQLLEILKEEIDK